MVPKISIFCTVHKSIYSALSADGHLRTDPRRNKVQFVNGFLKKRFPDIEFRSRSLCAER